MGGNQCGGQTKLMEEGDFFYVQLELGAKGVKGA